MNINIMSACLYNLLHSPTEPPLHWARSGHDANEGKNSGGFEAGKREGKSRNLVVLFPVKKPGKSQEEIKIKQVKC